MAVDLTLIGPALGALPHFIMGFEQMGNSARYGGKFRLKSVRSALEGSALIFDGFTRRIAPAIPLWQYAPQPLPISRMDFTFLTPLRMRTRGQYNPAPDFVAIAHALLRRVHLLAAIYGTGDGDAAWMKPLLALADEIKTEVNEFALYAWDRMSGRQHRRVDMDGVIGKLTVSGDLTAFAELVRFGEWINVGSGTSMGLGRYRAELS